MASIPDGGGDGSSADLDDEREALSSSAVPLDERILAAVRGAPRGGGGDDDDNNGGLTVRPAHLASELGLSVDDASRELCGLLAAVGGGEGGATFRFEAVGMPDATTTGTAEGKATTTATTTTMAFYFPPDFEVRARRFRRRSDWKRRLRALTSACVKAVKVFTAFGLIISLAVLIVAAICLLVAAAVALARGGNGGGGHHRNQLTHRLRYLFFQLRQLLWLYAICGSAVDGNQDPFLREVAGDLAFATSFLCGNPMHPFFWFRIGGMRRRWERVRRGRGWGGGSYDGGGTDGTSVARRGTWGRDDDDAADRSSFDSTDPRRGLLSVAVEFLFGPDDDDSISGEGGTLPPRKELEKWKYRASIVVARSSSSPGEGVSLRELLPYADDPPRSAEDPAASREALRIATHFNGKPAGGGAGGADESVSAADARFCFPELVAEADCRRLLEDLGSSAFAPPTSDGVDGTAVASILYKDDDEERYRDFGSSVVDDGDGIPGYLYERPRVLTELPRRQFGQCVLLGLLNLAGIVWVRNAVAPGGILELSGPRSGPLAVFASTMARKLLDALRFYAGLFFVLPLVRLGIVLARNWRAEGRNGRRRDLARANGSS
ncbi:hypothetical protein ACHAWF_013228 [Thalassiosira exigua]